MLAATAAQPPKAPTPSIRAQLDAYDARTAREGHPDRAALAAIARQVLEQERRSPAFAVWSEACASMVVPDSADCGPRLWAVLNGTTQPPAVRAEAAAALMTHGDAKASAALFDVLKDVETPKLAPLAPIIGRLPAGQAVPLLIRLATSSSPVLQGAACRVLGSFDTPDSRAALASVVAANPPGTETWLLCMVARARLRESDTAGALWGYGHGLGPDDQIYVAKAMVDAGHESAVTVLTDLTHRGTRRARVDAALLLAPADPDAAGSVATAAERDPDPEIRAAALEVERHLKRDPPERVRRMLLDASGLVRIRAAEVCIDWSSRHLSR